MEVQTSLVLVQLATGLSVRRSAVLCPRRLSAIPQLRDRSQRLLRIMAIPKSELLRVRLGWVGASSSRLPAVSSNTLGVANPYIQPVSPHALRSDPLR
jgi:hypothetical protein